MTTVTPRRALLDTSVLIDFRAARIAAVADEVAVSAVSIGELQYGVTTAPDPLAQLRRRRRVQAILDRFEVPSFDVSCAAGTVEHPRPNQCQFGHLDAAYVTRRWTGRR